MPSYSGLPRDKMAPCAAKDSFIKDSGLRNTFGQGGCSQRRSLPASFKCPPALVKEQKATELILRSAFLAERACHWPSSSPRSGVVPWIRTASSERSTTNPPRWMIIRCPTDRLRDCRTPGAPTDLVVTPEAALRPSARSELAAHVGLLVLMTTSSTAAARGITYELLPNVAALHDSQKEPEGADLSGHQQRRRLLENEQRGPMSSHNPDSDFQVGRFTELARSVGKNRTSTAVMLNKGGFRSEGD